jgi:hypothetical protein
MRALSGVAFLFIVVVASPALADTITYEVAFDFTQNGIGPQTVDGPQFNPALGTLTGVSAFVSGTYLPDITGASVPSSTTAFLSVEGVGYGGGGFGPANIGTYTLTDGRGPAQAFSFSTGPLLGLQNYIDIGGSPAFANGFLLNVDAYSEPPTPGTWGDFDDESLLSGNVQITYTYTVPEPSSLAILAFGASLLGLGVWRRRPVLA